MRLLSESPGHDRDTKLVRVPSLTPIDQALTCGYGSGLLHVQDLGTGWEQTPFPDPLKSDYLPAMANIVERPRRDGGTTYQVRWREGGGYGPVQTEKFG